MAEMSSNLGLFGTIIGMTAILSSLNVEAETIKPEEIAMILKSVAGGLGTALLTTMVGIMGNGLLKSVYSLFRREAEKAFRLAGGTSEAAVVAKKITAHKTPKLIGMAAAILVPLLDYLKRLRSAIAAAKQPPVGAPAVSKGRPRKKKPKAGGQAIKSDVSAEARP